MAEREDQNKEQKARVRAAAKHLHVRGFFGVNMAELDEAVRLTLGQGHCDPFESPAQSLFADFDSKEALVVAFLEGLLDDAVKQALDLVGQKIKDAREHNVQPGAEFDPIREVLHAGVNDTLLQFQRFRYLIAGTVSEGLSLRRVDPFLLAETRRVAHCFFSGLLGLWGQDNGDPLVDQEIFWANKYYDPSNLEAVDLIRRHLDRPLGDAFLVEGLYMIYGGATLWWLTNRSHNPAEPLAALDDLTMLVASLIRRSNGPAPAAAPDPGGDSLLRRALKIEKRIRNIHFAEPLTRFIPKARLERLGQRLLEIAYAQVPKRIAIANNLVARP